MNIHIIDLKTGAIVKITDCDQFKNINIGHKMVVNYKDNCGNNKRIDGTICSIKHEIYNNSKSFDYILKIKVY